MRFGEYFRVRTDPAADVPTDSCMAAPETPRTPVVTVASSSARVVMFASTGTVLAAVASFVLATATTRQRGYVQSLQAAASVARHRATRPTPKYG